VAHLERSNEVVRERNLERLAQVEAMREQATRFADTKAKGDNAGLMRVKQALSDLMEKFMMDVDADERDRLLPDVVETWKGQVLAVVKDALEFLVHFDGEDPAPEPRNSLGPLRRAIGAATYLMEAVGKEVQDLSEERLRDLAKKLGAAKTEIMVMNRNLMVGQSASLATEARELASEAGEAIKASRDGSGLRHIGGQRPHQGPTSTSNETCNGEPGCRMGTKKPASSLGLVLAEHAGYDHVAPPQSWHRDRE
jgi:hypothetical protein